uniref:Protein kinase n=1 Tax=Schistosoma mansoni TaxID=6183 RepID=A0A3Q0KQQ2_SCHMA
MNASHVNNTTTNNNNHITNTNYTTNHNNNISNIKNNKNISIDFPTNPITKYFIINKQIASCGPELIWKVYDAVRRQDQLPCSVFLFDKSIADKLHKPRRRDIVTSVLKRDVRLLTQLHHPNMLHILHPIEETSETLSFASERIFSSLANILGNHTRLQQFIIENLKTFRFTDMDRKLGIYQLTELLRFLHTGQSLFHNNVSPSSILITHQNQWRLGSAAFIESTCLEKHDISQYELGPSPWTRKWPKMAQPDCHYSAPECLNLINNNNNNISNHFTSYRNKPTTDLYHSTNKNDPDHTIDPITSTMKSNDKPGPWSDMFSLGLIICALYTNNSPAEGSIQWLQNIKKRDYDNDTYSNTDVLYVNCKENIIQETNNNVQYNIHSIYVHIILGDFIFEYRLIMRIYNVVIRFTVQRLNKWEFAHFLFMFKIPEAFRLSVCRMPLELVEPVEKLLSRNPQKRPSSQLFALLKFFNDPTMLLLDGIINFQVKSDEDRTRALQILQNNAENLSKPILYGRIMPTLIQLHRELETRQFNKQINDYNTTMLTSHFNISQLSNEEICINLDSLLISGLAHLIEVCSSIDYTDYIEKDLINIFEKSSNLKTKICLVRHTRSFLRQVPDNVIDQYILPLMKQCLVSNNITAQIVALNNLELLVGYISVTDLEIIVLQKIKQAFQYNNQQLQLASLHCLVTILTRLSDATIVNDVIPFLLNVSNELKLNINNNKPTDKYVQDFNIDTVDDKAYDEHDQTQSNRVEQPISELCNAWKQLLYTKSYLLEPQLIVTEIFPGLLPHVVDKKVSITEFRILMSTLYALLDQLDIPNAENDDLNDSKTQYRTVPALTVNPPSVGSGQISKRSSNCENLEDTRMAKKSITRTTASFVPMLHPNQIKELENSPNITRRASAHVICPLPPQNSDLRFDKPTSDINLSDKKNYTSFLGLQLPSVSKLRRHSCDAQRQEKNTSSHMQVDKMNDNLSRRSSDQSLQDNDRTNWYTIPKSRGLLNSEEKNLLTAQVCEGPFIRTSNIQTKLNWNSSQVNEPVKQITSNNKLGNELSVGPRTSRRSSLIAIGDSVINLLTK